MILLRSTRKLVLAEGANSRQFLTVAWGSPISGRPTKHFGSRKAGDAPRMCALDPPCTRPIETGTNPAEAVVLYHRVHEGGDAHV